MKKTIHDILKEEINREIKSMKLDSPGKIANVIKELFTFSTSSILKNMGNQEEVLDEKDALPKENWDWLISMINEAFNDNPEEWQKLLKQQKLNILCYKYFTKEDLIDLDEVEKDLKLNIKKYFSALQNYSDLDNFREKFFNLPSEMVKNFCRFILNHSKKLNNEIPIDKKELKDRIESLAKDRKEVIEKIALVSRKYQSVLDLTKIKELYENGLFFEDNFLNRGVNEYISKLCNSPAVAKMKDTFNSVFVQDIQSQAENSASYLAHIRAIKTEEGQEFFTAKGFQVGVRFDNALETSKNTEKQQGLVVDKDSRFKEPKSKIEPVAAPGAGGDAMGGLQGDPTDAGAAGGGGLGGDLGGGGGDFGGGFGGPSGVDDIPTGEAGTTGAGGPSDTGEDGTETGEGSEESMPADDDGFPEDFGTPEDNSETTNDDDTEEKK
jgi:hypothetical protein